MLDWLSAGGEVSTLTPVVLSSRFFASVMFGLAVAAVFRTTHGKHHADKHAYTTTLVLLSILIAMVTLTIGNNVARAFSLVGALSIVRFRTVVEDTRDTAFVIFAVIVGMAAGTGLFSVAILGIPTVYIAAGLLSSISVPRTPRPTRYNIQIRLGLGRDPEAVLQPTLEHSFENVHVIEVSTARQGAALDITYSGRLRPDAALPTIVAQLNGIEGVMSVDARAR